MTRIQILLSYGQNEKLTSLAKRLNTSKSKLIREAIDILLREKVPESYDPILNLIGQAGKAGRSDISSHHDEFLNRKEKDIWTERRSL